MQDGGGSIGTAFSSTGRAGVPRALVATLVAGVVFGLAWVALDRGGMIAYVLAGAVAGAMLAKLAAEWVRRLHDTGVSGVVGAVVGAVAAAAIIALTVSSLRYDSPAIYAGVWIVVAIIAAAALLRPGARGDNRYGPPPPGALAASGTRGGGLVWAIVATLGGALIGYALIDISQGMRESQDRARAYVEAEARR